MPLLCLHSITIERACITAVGSKSEGWPAGSTNEKMSSIRDDGATAIAEALKTFLCQEVPHSRYGRRNAKALAN
jgi:hypothetical protein